MYNIPSVITLNCTHHGRYAIYFNNRRSRHRPSYYSKFAFNELCEFEVYGEFSFWIFYYILQTCVFFAIIEQFFLNSLKNLMFSNILSHLITSYNNCLTRIIYFNKKHVFKMCFAFEIKIYKHF